MKNGVELCSVYPNGGIAKRLTTMIDSPLPRLTVIDIPLSGSGYTTSKDVFYDCSSHCCMKIGDFRLGTGTKRFIKK